MTNSRNNKQLASTEYTTNYIEKELGGVVCDCASLLYSVASIHTPRAMEVYRSAVSTVLAVLQRVCEKAESNAVYQPVRAQVHEATAIIDAVGLLLGRVDTDVSSVLKHQQACLMRDVLRCASHRLYMAVEVLNRACITALAADPKWCEAQYFGTER